METAPAKRPARVTMAGRVVTLEPLDAVRHGNSLWAASSGEANAGLWTYLFDGPHATREAFHSAVGKKGASEDPLFFAIVENASGEAVGWASFMRIEPAHRVIEVGSILMTPRLQRTTGATEAMYLMARHAFEELGNRRYEWKCDARNEPSRRAALRLGFRFEGIFRQHMIVKGRNRDTAWYSMVDGEWPARRAEFERWLEPRNFDRGGRQRTRLAMER